MGFKCGLVGLPNSGKSTIFNAITNLGVEASAYPFCTIDPHFGIVPLEDDRLNRIQQMIGSAKKTPTILEFVDIAGLVQGASKGEGLGNQFLSHIGRVDAIAHVVRCFEDPNVSHPYETLNPIRDVQIVTTELILKDLEIVEKRFAKCQNVAKSGDLQAKKLCIDLEQFVSLLSSGKTIRSMNLNSFQKQLARELNLLTAKPEIFIANGDENHLTKNSLVESLNEYALSLQSPCISLCGKVQAEISTLDQKDQLEFLQAMGLDETGLQKLVNAGYTALELITFYTANENEAHAWTIPKGTLALHAAGQVHTDFERGFIKAEVMAYDDLIKYGSPKALHDRGLVLIHGKDYIVKDGDVIFFRVKT